MKDNKIETYFNTLGIYDINDSDKFWDNLEKKYGANTCIMLDSAMNDRGNPDNQKKIYVLKNKSLDLSMDFTTYSKDLYRGYLSKIIELNLNPNKILDIACDNGIVACFYGIIYPNAEIMGIDISGNAIKCAKELAEKLELSNVKFEQIDIKKLNKVCKEKEFDLITSVRSLKEIYALPNDVRVWNLSEADKVQVVKKHKIAISKLSEFLSEDGLLITFERLASSEEQIYFNNLFNEAGLILNKDISCKINFHELGDNQIMPLMIYSKGRAIESSYDLILNKLSANEDTINYENFINNSKENSLILGIQVNYRDGSGKMRHEIWDNKDNLVFLKYSNIGYREFKYYTRDELQDIKNIIEQEKEMMIFYGQGVYEYESIEEREKIK